MGTSILLRSTVLHQKARRGRLGIASPRRCGKGVSPKSGSARFPDIRLYRWRFRAFLSSSLVAVLARAGKAAKAVPADADAAAVSIANRSSEFKAETSTEDAAVVVLKVASDGDAASDLSDTASEAKPPEAVETTPAVTASEQLRALSIGGGRRSVDPLTGSCVEPRASDERLAEGYSAIILRMIDRTSIEPKMTCFHAVRPPPIQMPDYLDRIQTFFDCSGACYILGLLYLRRLLEKNPDIKMTPLSCHRLVSVALTVAVKFHEDNFHDNIYYAKIAGVKVPEFNGLESRFIQLLDWKLHALPHEYDAVQRDVCDELGMQL